MKRLSGDLHHVSKLLSLYQDPSSSASPDILYTRLLCYTNYQSRKREIIQSNIYRVLLVVNDPSSSGSPDILFTRLLYCTNYQSRKREIIQSNIYRILLIVNDPSSSGSPDILFTRLLYYTKRESRKREIIQSNTYRILPCQSCHLIKFIYNAHAQPSSGARCLNLSLRAFRHYKF